MCCLGLMCVFFNLWETIRGPPKAAILHPIKVKIKVTLNSQQMAFEHIGMIISFSKRFYYNEFAELLICYFLIRYFCNLM